MSKHKRRDRAPQAHPGARPRQTRKPLLDACLIVRNESVHLPGCLASLRRLGDALHAINVYDTGSTDDTIALARAAGCTVEEGYWDDDFARARNASLAMSRAEWAIVIDADERLVANVDVLVEALQAAGDANVVDAELYHLDGDGARAGHTRYIKAVRPAQIRFARPIHEVVDARPGFTVRFVRLEPEQVHFTHLGYSTAEVRRGKAARNFAVADAAVAAARDNGDLDALVHALRQRARSRLGYESRQGAIDDFRECWALLPVGSPEWITCARDLFDKHLHGGDVGAATQVLDTLQQADVPPVHWLRQQGELLLRQGRLGQAKDVADRLLRETEAGSLPGVAPGDLTDRRDVLDLRYRIALEAQEHAVAVAICVLLINQGEMDRVAALCTLWLGSVEGLVAALRPAAEGPHLPDLIRALRAQGPQGRAVGDRLAPPDGPQIAGATVDHT